MPLRNYEVLVASMLIHLSSSSDSVGNKGALINITSDIKLDYKTFDAVVSLSETNCAIHLLARI